MIMNIVIVGGGTGTSVVAGALQGHGHHVTALVNVFDTGGSTGKLANAYGVTPMGDVRQVILALVSDPAKFALRDFLRDHYYTLGDLKGVRAGNLLLADEESKAWGEYGGSFVTAICRFRQLLGVKEDILPVSLDSAALVYRKKNGLEPLRGEREISGWLTGQDTVNLSSFGLIPASSTQQCLLLPGAREAIMSADHIVLAPANFFLSLVPTLLVDGMKDALEACSAQLTYVCNLMREKGVLAQYGVRDYAAALAHFLPSGRLNTVLYNEVIPDEAKWRGLVRADDLGPVEYGEEFEGCQSFGADLWEDAHPPSPSTYSEMAATRNRIRHDKEKLADALARLWQ